MNPRNEIEQYAHGGVERSRIDSGEPRPTIMLIDGHRWQSPTPQNAGDAESFNDVARRLCEEFP